jgi:uncharacterized membrane protein (DUF485 family)
MPRKFKKISSAEKQNQPSRYNRAEEEAVLRELAELDELTDSNLPDIDAPLYDPPDEETLQEVAEQTTYGAVFLNDLIRRQRALSLSVAITFLVILFSLPLINYFLRTQIAFEILGFQITWFFLGILIYPLLWALAFYFVTTADKYEEQFTKLVK